MYFLQLNNIFVSFDKCICSWLHAAPIVCAPSVSPTNPWIHSANSGFMVFGNSFGWHFLWMVFSNGLKLVLFIHRIPFYNVSAHFCFACNTESFGMLAKRFQHSAKTFISKFVWIILICMDCSALFVVLSQRFKFPAQAGTLTNRTIGNEIMDQEIIWTLFSWPDFLGQMLTQDFFWSNLLPHVLFSKLLAQTIDMLIIRLSNFPKKSIHAMSSLTVQIFVACQTFVNCKFH